MIIGFTTRTVCVPENNTEPGFDVWFLPIEVATLRTAEREHPMIFRVQEASSSAIVEPIGDVVNQLYDATFGTRNNFGDPIEVFFVLEALEDTISPQTAFIRDDRRLEDAKECFTIRIFPVDVPGRRELFTCNEDDVGADNYFCQHTICVEDDDGRFATFTNINIANSTFCNVSDPFVVAFVEKIFTVDESVGAVNVCVNLTRPLFDILDDRVNVFVIDNSSSIYIPPGASLASESSHNILHRFIISSLYLRSS